MNTKKNQQYQTTHQKIQQSLLTLLKTKKLEQISVREICSLTQINRSTFYSHYDSIYDLLAEMDSLIRIDHITMFHAANVELERFFDKEGLSIALHYIYEHKELYRTYIGQFNCIEYIQSSFDDLWNAAFWEPDSDRELLLYEFILYMGGAFRMIEYWLENDCQKPIDEVVDILAAQAPKELKTRIPYG